MVAGGKGVEMIVDEVAGGGGGAEAVVAEDVGRDNDSVGLNIL